MDKRYQVFVSSTYLDLVDERAKITHTLLQLDCIPAGMELFPAADEEQFEFIKKIIDDCDYYLLIIGGRYGSVGKDGISFTEKEYDYAVAKGMKVIALLHAAPGGLPVDKVDTEPKKKRKLEAFRKKVRTGRLVKTWTNTDDLNAQVMQAVTFAIKTYPATGWVRGGMTGNPELLEKLEQLRTENERLRVEADQKARVAPDWLADGDQDVDVGAQRLIRFGNQSSWSPLRSVTLTWNEIIAVLTPRMLTPQFETVISDILGRYCAQRQGIASATSDAFLLVDDSLQKIKLQLHALGYVIVYIPQGQSVLAWSLTPRGQSRGIEISAVKSELKDPGRRPVQPGAESAGPRTAG